MDVSCASSTGRRNSVRMIGSENHIERLGRGTPAQRLARPGVERVGDGGEGVGAMDAEIRALREVLAEQAVGVLIGATLPGTMRVAEVDRDPGVDPQPGMLRHLDPLIPG